MRDALDRGSYERGDAPGQGHRNGHRTHCLKTAEGGLEYSAPQVMNAIERELPAGKAFHVILDNYAAPKHPKVLAWLDRQPRWTLHFTRPPARR